MTTLYIYDTEGMSLVARISGETNKSCEDCAARRYGDLDRHGWTYSPAFGFANGLLPGDDVQDIDASVRACERCGFEGDGWLDDGETCPA